jgi:hypothetical protein
MKTVQELIKAERDMVSDILTELANREMTEYKMSQSPIPLNRLEVYSVIMEKIQSAWKHCTYPIPIDAVIQSPINTIRQEKRICNAN